jgi:hypothetical protein
LLLSAEQNDATEDRKQVLLCAYTAQLTHTRKKKEVKSNQKRQQDAKEIQTAKQLKK